MVQFVKGGPSRSSMIADILGNSLGEGLGNFVGDYYANKALDEIKNDKSLENAPQSEKMSRLEAALRPHGQRGLKMLQSQMGIEQQRSQEQTQGILGKLLSGKDVSDKEFSKLPANVQIEAGKLRQPKAPTGGLTGQPVPQEISLKIPEILNANKEASADELAVKFDEQGIPRAYSNSYIENRRRQDETKAKQIREDEKIDYQSFKDNKDYTEKVLNGFEAFKRDKIVLDQMENLSNKGDLPKPVSVALLNKIGIPLGVLENPNAEQFDKLSTELLKNIQGTFGNRILQSEVNLFMRSIPTLLNSEEGQKKLISQWKTLNEGKRIYYDAYKDVRTDNPKRLPPDLHEKVLEKAEPMLDDLAKTFRNLNQSENVMMKGPDGKIRNIPRTMLDQALKSGGELIE